MSRPQTIQISLPAGDPRGMGVAEITTRIVRVIEVPSSQLPVLLKTLGANSAQGAASAKQCRARATAA